MKMIPRNLNVGMRVKALCMGKIVGDYIVSSVGSYNRRPAAFLMIRGDESSEAVVVTERRIDAKTHAVKVLHGQKIQCTDYYFQDECESLERERELLYQRAKKAVTDEEKEMIHAQLMDNESTLNIIKEEMDNSK